MNSHVLILPTKKLRIFGAGPGGMGSQRCLLGWVCLDKSDRVVQGCFPDHEIFVGRRLAPFGRRFGGSI